MATVAKASNQQISALTWNIEGIRRHIFFLAEILNREKSYLAFLSEPQVYQCDLPNITQYISHDYCFALNSDDIYDPDLPMVSSKALGGTMVLWRKCLDPYVKVIQTVSSAYLPILLTVPGCQPSVHVALYLPTHSKDAEFVSVLASLMTCLDSLINKYSNLCIYLRGDANVNLKNKTRVTLLDSFKEQFSLVSTPIHHKTYHHFVGHGEFDSNVDIILHSSGKAGSEVFPETVTDILCKDNYPMISSHHDIILSTLVLPPGAIETQDVNTTTAPRLSHDRHQIIWSEEGISNYSTVVSTQLKRIRETWLKPDCQASMSLALQLTNTIMSKAAMETNKYRILGKKCNVKGKNIPRCLKRAQKRLNDIHRKYKTSPTPVIRDRLRIARKFYHQTVRSFNLKSDMERDIQLYDIMGKNPGKLFRYIRAMKNTGSGQLAKLAVGKVVYTGDKVADGFYESMSSLKRCDLTSLESVPELSNKFIDYHSIIKLCKNGGDIPKMTMDQSKKLLSKFKKGVKDHYSITVEHYINAGYEGLKHFNCLLNSIITDLNNASIEELNTAHGLIFYKGHRKDKESERSYRTISSCPFLAKGLDMYIRDMCKDLWQDQQADTQYQGSGSSHELASLLLTEVIQYSLYVARQPVYLLALDAQSAFDRCLRQVLTSELYKASVPPAAILFIDRRLASRSTVYEWEGQMLGPARDITGFEQGGVNSSDYYKLYNNEQLKSAQSSGLGVDIGSGAISAVGQADDVVLVAPSPYHLQLLVTLTEEYCTKYRVKLEASKTKLLAYQVANQAVQADPSIDNKQIIIFGEPIKMVTEAEHVGVLRSSGGNLPHILNRVAMHKNVLHALLPAGLARRHRGSPRASLKISQLYGVPVLLSGLASLVLTRAELGIVDAHYLAMLQGLLRLHKRTPRSIVYFLSGSLPASALLHQRQMTLFSMICHLKEDPLHQHAKYALEYLGSSSKSWFTQIRQLCIQYGLPHPLQLLNNPLSKGRLKSLVKTRITEYWQKLLSAEATALPSLAHFNPHMHQLSSPHPIWSAAASNPYEINKATILSRMISGRYRTERLCRFWSENREGFCLLQPCHSQGVYGDLEHLLLHCPALETVRENMYQMWRDKASVLPPLSAFVTQALESPPNYKLKFILDSQSLPEIICLSQNYGQAVTDIVLYMTRTFAYGVHKRKLILMGLWPYDSNNQKRQKNLNKNNPICVAGVPHRADRPGASQPGVTGLPHSSASPGVDLPCVAGAPHSPTSLGVDLPGVASVPHSLTSPGVPQCPPST